MYSVCIVIYVSMYPCIYIATHLHTVYLECVQAGLGSNWRCGWKRRSSEFGDTLDRANLEAIIERVQRYTWRPSSSEFGDTLAGRNRANVAIHLEVVIEWLGDALGGNNRAGSEIQLESAIVRTWRPQLRELEDTLGGRDRASWRCTWRPWSGKLEMPLEAVIVRTGRPWSNEFQATLGGCDGASLEMHLEAVIEPDWTSTWRRSKDGPTAAETLFIS